MAIMILRDDAVQLEKPVQVDKESIVKTKVKKEEKTPEPKPVTTPKILTETKKKVEVKKQKPMRQENLNETFPLLDPIDFTGKSEPALYFEPNLEIDQIMEEQKKIDTFVKDIYVIKKKEDWKIDYEVGLEDGVIDDLKTDKRLKLEMLNGKVGFSKSF